VTEFAIQAVATLSVSTTFQSAASRSEPILPKTRRKASNTKAVLPGNWGKPGCVNRLTADKTHDINVSFESHVATIDRKNPTRHYRRFIAGQIYDKRGDLFGCRDRQEMQ
jgi:hypothetical protein